LIDFVPVLLWVIIAIFHLDRIVAEGVGQSAQTEVIIQRYDLFSMLISYCVSAFVTGLNQSLVGRNGIAAIWLVMAIICSLILKPVVNADVTDGKIYRLQQIITKHKIVITIIVFLLVVGTELLPILIWEGI
jgi:hypothetical protein